MHWLVTHVLNVGFATAAFALCYLLCIAEEGRPVTWILNLQQSGASWAAALGACLPEYMGPLFRRLVTLHVARINA